MEPILKSSHSRPVLLGCEPVSSIRVGQLLEVPAAQPACPSQPPEPPAWAERRAGGQLESELACERKRWPLPESLLPLCRGSSQLDVHPTLLLARSSITTLSSLVGRGCASCFRRPSRSLGCLLGKQYSIFGNKRLWNQIALVELCTFT